MKIIVLNGSPKGQISVTMQYVAFIQKKHPEHEFVILDIAQQIKHIESNAAAFHSIIADIAAADAVLWAFPLYVCLVHGNYKRFIELVAERKATAAFGGKHTAVLTTSIRFFDHTAHNYVQGICDDWAMKFYAAYSADMDDLFKAAERERLLRFAHGFLQAVQQDETAGQAYSPLVHDVEYLPAAEPVQVDTMGRKVVILTDAAGEEGEASLNRMLAYLTTVFNGQAQVVNLRALTMAGGCLGCLCCGYDNTCRYNGKDDFTAVYNSTLKTADVLIFAGSIRDRYLSSTWKTFFDRAFFNTHIPSFAGKQIGFLISGPLRQLPNLREILTAYTEWQQANLAGFVTDEDAGEPGKVDSLLRQLAGRSLEYAGDNYIKPLTFLGWGGRKIFRDEIWGAIRFPFAADHLYYKRHGLYDFPQQDYGVRLRNLVMGLFVKIPFIRKEIYEKQMIGKMVEPYKKLLAKL